MNTAELLPPPVRRWLFALIVSVMVGYTAGMVRLHAQDAQPAHPQTQDKQAPAQAPSDQAGSDKDEIKITPRQAEELFHSVDEILEFDSKFTGLPIKHTIKRRLTGRDEVVSFLKQSSEEDTQRLKRSELVLKKFGLLPRNFDLETFLVSLLREEVDRKSTRLNSSHI